MHHLLAWRISLSAWLQHLKVCSSICVGVCFVCSVFTWFNKISKITLKLYMIIHLGISLTACVHCTCCVLLLFSSIENWHWLLLVTPWKYNQIKPTFSPFRARADCVVCEYQQNDKNSNFDNAQYTDSKNDDDRKNTSIFNRQRKGVCYELVYPICVFIVVQRHRRCCCCRRSWNSCGRFRITIQSTELPYSTENFLGRFNQ